MVGGIGLIFHEPLARSLQLHEQGLDGSAAFQKAEPLLATEIPYVLCLEREIITVASAFLQHYVHD